MIKKLKLLFQFFAGRAADTGKDPIPEFKKSILSAKKFKNVEILWASVREPYNLYKQKNWMPYNNDTPLKLLIKLKDFGKSLKSIND